MEQFILEHSLWEMLGYSAILGVALAIAIGAIISVVKFIREEIELKREQGMPWWDLD